MKSPSNWAIAAQTSSDPTTVSTPTATTPPASTQVIDPSDHATIVRNTQAPTAISNANNPALNSSLWRGGRRVTQTTERPPKTRTATATRMSRNTNAYSDGTSEREKLIASRRCSRWNTARSATPNARATTNGSQSGAARNGAVPPGATRSRRDCHADQRQPEHHDTRDRRRVAGRAHQSSPSVTWGMVRQDQPPSVQRVPVQDESVQRVPVQRVPDHEVPVHVVPVQRVPVQRVPVQRVPVQRVPVHELVGPAGPHPRRHRSSGCRPMSHRSSGCRSSGCRSTACRARWSRR